MNPTDSPLPKPRVKTQEVKRPVPTPRRRINKSQSSGNEIQQASPVEENVDHNNTLTKRVSSASRQLAGDCKRVVIQGTRQSVRKITRRFSSSSQDNNIDQEREINPKNDEDTISIFSTIRFNSPISQNENIYNNVDNDEVYISSDEEITSFPPPAHPPPPLPDESTYDSPSSISLPVNSEHSKSTKARQDPYESVFPILAQQSDSDSISSLSRSGSWKFYDAVDRGTINQTDGNTTNRVDVNTINQVDVNYNGSDNNSDSNANSLYSSCYENYEFSLPKANPRPSKSVILQFDPLSKPESLADPTEQSNDLKFLEELLQGDLYGNISSAHTIDEWSISNESEIEDFSNPPTPPVRFDSLPEDEEEEEAASTTPTKQSNQKSKTNWFTAEPCSTPVENKKHSWFKQVKGVLEKAPDVVKGVKNKDNVVERAALGAKKFVQKKGMLYKVQNGPVEDLFGEYSGRWCVLENSNFICYSDNSCQHLKEHFPAQNILSVQILQDKKYNYRYDNDDLYCFELNTTGKSRGGDIYGTRNAAERRLWIQVIAESLTNKFPSKITSNYLRMGWAYVREGVSGKWMGAWAMLSERKFYYVTDNQPIKKMDLRKVRCIILQQHQDTDNNPKTNDRGPNIIVDTPDIVLYLRMWTSRETKVWCHLVKLEAHNNGANLDQQQLTKNDIPVLVEKCINFIYAHGSMTEGIYRRPGTGSLVSDLLSKLRKDAFSVQLTTDQYTELEVGTALKRFFRDLPEPLLGSSQRQYLHEVSKHKDAEEQIRMYKAALDQLPTISYNTIRKLFGHLHFISSQCEKNLMTVENLAAIWGPTLLHNEESVTNRNHQRDTEVVNQLIKYYKHVFPEDVAEMEKEKLMLNVLRKHLNAQGEVKGKSAGDLRIWIFLHNKEGQSFNVSVGPSKTAYEICKELCKYMKLQVHELILEEVVLQNKLIRPVHYEEKVLDVVLKWSYWNELDRKDNHLILAPLSKYWELILDKPLPVSGELRFADNKSKSFRLFTFQFSQGKLICYKDKSGETTLHCWNIEDIIWYFGHEPKRSPPTRWSITFIEKDTHPIRTKNASYFGYVLVWGDAAVRANWLSAMLKARYPSNLAPPPNLVSL